MCGRYTLFASYDELLERFLIESAFDESDYLPSYNIAPSQSVVAIINDGMKNRLGSLRWGLIPPWAKDEKIGYKMINARGETLSEKPSFRNAYKKKRCIIPADSFYEWQRKPDGKAPMRIMLKDDSLFAFAGLWESWKSQTGKMIHTCTIITTEANKLIEPIHERMPVILNREDEEIWLNPSIEDSHVLDRLIKPFEDERMMVYEVSSAVSSPKNNNESLIVPVN